MAETNVDSSPKTILGQVLYIWYPVRVQKDLEAISVIITMAVMITITISIASMVTIARMVTIAITSFSLQIKLGKIFFHPWQYKHIVCIEENPLGWLTRLQITKQVKLFNTKKVTAAPGGPWSKHLLLGLGGQECPRHCPRRVFVSYRCLFSQL